MASEPAICDDPRSGPTWPEAATVLHGVPYRVYVRLWKNPRNEHYRMTYYDGTLEIRSPEFLCERSSERIGMIIRAVVVAYDIPCLGSGSTTFCRGQRNRLKGKGKEPDQSFYFFDHIGHIADKDTIDLDVDPPPDLWIEVDNRGSSKGCLPLYAELGVPEVWRYRVQSGRLWFGRLDRGGYTTIDRSMSLSMLTPERVVFALARCSNDDTAWDNWLRAWIAAGMPTDAP